MKVDIAWSQAPDSKFSMENESLKREIKTRYIFYLLYLCSYIMVPIVYIIYITALHIEGSTTLHYKYTQIRILGYLCILLNLWIVFVLDRMTEG